ncbi:uncharacterized protein METZ01_LOCUS34262 [marine metagenome]|uniref:Uncharacterized protein n=1 Tax=marine metagenome TaxID=408172 RepID=A0A381QRR6_9ZZZZ
MRRTRAGSPATSRYSTFRRWETSPTRSPPGEWIPICAPTYRFESNESTTTSPSGRQISSSSSRPSQDSSLCDSTTTSACRPATVAASAPGISRFRLNTLLVASSRQSMRLQAIP